MSFGKDDFQDISECLIPEREYEIDLALGTTYSADFKMVLFLLYRILGYSGNGDAEDNPVQVRESQLMKSFLSLRDKVRIIYHPGHYSVHDKSGIACFLDEILREYPTHGNFSFHPKTLFLRFKRSGKAEYEYRMIVLSRNFTENISMDVFFAAKLVPDVNGADEIHHFLKQMASILPNRDQKKYLELAKELKGCSIIPLGDAKEVENPKFFWQNGMTELKTKVSSAWVGSNRLVIVSPFLDLKGLKAITEGYTGKTIVLVSERCTFDELNHDKDFVEYVEKQKISTYATRADDGTPEMMTNLHAKMILSDRGKQGLDIVIGSANVTDRGFNKRNIEAVVHFKAPFSNLEQIFLDEWIGGDDIDGFTIVEKYDLKYVYQAPRAKNFSEVVLDIVSKMHITIEYVVQGKSVIAQLQFHNLDKLDIPQGMVIEVSPLNSPNKKDLDINVSKVEFIFTEAKDYTCQYIFRFISLTGERSLEYIRTLDPCFDLLESRKNHLITQTINKEGIFKQLELLLKPVSFQQKKNRKKGPPRGEGGSFSGLDFPVSLEELMLNCLKRPEVVKSIHEVFTIPIEGINEIERMKFEKLKILWSQMSGAFIEKA